MVLMKPGGSVAPADLPALSEMRLFLTVLAFNHLLSKLVIYRNLSVLFNSYSFPMLGLFVSGKSDSFSRRQ